MEIYLILNELNSFIKVYQWDHAILPFACPFLLGTVFFRIALPCSGGYHMERGGMPLHDAVGINCKNGANTENQRIGVKYMG